MPNFFSTYGLAMRGAGESQAEDRAAQLELERINQAQQQRALTGQQIQVGQWGIEDTQRARTTQEQVRQAGAQAYGAGKTMGGSLLDMSDAARRSGNMPLALQFDDSYRKFEQLGAPEWINATRTNRAPGERNDIVQIMNRYESLKGVQSAQYDDETDTLTVTRQGQPPAKLKVSVIAEMMGLKKQPQVIQTPAGGVSTIVRPGQANETISAAPKEDPGKGYLKLREGERAIDIRPGSPTFGQEIQQGGTQTGLGRRDREELFKLSKEIVDAVKDRQEMSTTTQDPANPLATVKTLTDKGETVASLAIRLMQANKGDMDHVSAVNIVQNAYNGWEADGKKIDKSPLLHDKRTGKWSIRAVDGRAYDLATPAGIAEEQPTTSRTVLTQTPVASSSGEPFKPTGPATSWKPTVGERSGYEAVRRAGSAPMTITGIDEQNANQVPSSAQQGLPASPPPTTRSGTIPQVIAQGPDVAAGVPLSRAGINPSRIAALRKEAEMAQKFGPARKSVAIFRDIASSPRMSPEDIPLIREALEATKTLPPNEGLSPEEIIKANRMLEAFRAQPAARAHGGMITRQQGYGLQ